MHVVWPNSTVSTFCGHRLAPDHLHAMLGIAAAAAPSMLAPCSKHGMMPRLATGGCILVVQTKQAMHTQVGGGRLSDAVQLLTTSVPFWAALAGAALAVTGTPLPPTLAAIAPPLAAAHLPLALVRSHTHWDLLRVTIILQLCGCHI